MQFDLRPIAKAPPEEVPEELSEALIDRLREGKLELPLLPDVAMQVLSMARARDADAHKLADVLQRDQTLAGHVLRLANSAAHAARVPIVSLQQAISRLGLGTLRDMVVAVTVRGKVFAVAGCADLVRPMWTHALAVGYWAKEIARHRRDNVESAFLCGLLHDIGNPVVLQAIQEIQRDQQVRYPRRVLESAMQHFHGVVGGALVGGWNMPEAVIESIYYHHDYRAAGAPKPMAMVVQLADLLSEWIGIGHGVTRSREEIEAAPVIDDLNLYPDDLERLLGMRERIAQLVVDVDN